LVYADSGSIKTLEMIYQDISIGATTGSEADGTNTGNGADGTTANDNASGDKAVNGDNAASGKRENWKFEFPESVSLTDFRSSFPFLVRASRGDAWYFIYLSGAGNEDLETWYDEDGNALGIYGYFLQEIGKDKRIASIRDYTVSGDTGLTERYFDSRNFLTELDGPEGIFRVLYFHVYLPRYWERHQREGYNGGDGNSAAYNAVWGNFSLQWDDGGSLVRITRELSGEVQSADDPVDYRYEYNLDEKGNWIERKEIRMIRRFGFLVPVPGITIKRTLEYKNTPPVPVPVPVPAPVPTPDRNEQ
ncbi:MAG: hypothetical protein FWF26_02230, partial [Treponema sp.]|nr:hypothetical protein [Treponema sp.]